MTLKQARRVHYISPLTVALFLFFWVAYSPINSYAINWPASGDYSTWIYDGEDTGIDAQEDIISIDMVRYEESTGNFFFYFRINVRDQRSSQLTSVSHALFLDVDQDGAYDYVLYNPTTGAGALELAGWNDTLGEWDTDAPYGIDYSGQGYTRDASPSDNYVEFALPVDDIGDPSTLERVAVGGQGAFNIDGNTSNAPDPSQWGDITPTLVNLVSFTATKQNGQVIIEWVTDSEIDTVGFYLERYDKPGQRWIRLNDMLLPGMITSPQGGQYSYIDQLASDSSNYLYRLLEMEITGNINVYGPFRVTPALASLAQASSEKPVAHQVGVNGFSRQQRLSTSQQQKKGSPPLRKLLSAQLSETPATGNVLKIPVPRDGLYYLDAAQIASLLGIAVADVQILIRDGLFVLSNQGNEIPYLRDETDTGLYFYGKGIRTLYTDKNIYWLTRGTSSQLLANNPITSIPSVVPGTFLDTLHVEADKAATPTLFTDPMADFWLWEYVFADYPGLDSKNFIFTVPDLDPAADVAELTLNLQGASSVADGNDHHVTVQLNGTLIGESRWKGINSHTVSWSFPADLLQEGSNTITVSAVLDTGVPASIFFIDSFDVKHKRMYKAVAGSLALRGDTNPVVQVEGFSNADILVLDVSSPNRPTAETLISTFTTSDGYGVRFVPKDSATEYFVTELGSATEITNTYPDKPSWLKNSSGAEWIIIGPDSLLAAASSLADHRASQGLVTLVVDIEDVYDEFSYGLQTPHAINDFLMYAYNQWDIQPQYVVLAGDGSYDYRDVLGNGDCLVPPPMIATEFGLFPSDAFLGDINGDNVPEIAVGRLPAKTNTELAGMVNKIIQFDALPLASSLMVADDPDEGGDFPAYNEALSNLYPERYNLAELSLQMSEVNMVKQSLMDNLNSGIHWLTYTGHSGTNQFAAEGLLTGSDALNLTNSHYPFISAFTCFMGNFSYPGSDTLGEKLITNPNGGAAALLAASGPSRVADGTLLGEFFFNAIFTYKEKIAGDALLHAYRSYANNGGNTSIPLLYSFLGDPAISLFENWMVAKQSKEFSHPKGTLYKRSKHQLKINQSTVLTGEKNLNGF